VVSRQDDSVGCRADPGKTWRKTLQEYIDKVRPEDEEDNPVMKLKTEKELEAKLIEIEKDVRLSYRVALVEINAPLALEQVHLAAQGSMLRWALGLPQKKYHVQEPS